jgi:hypothetical protein
MKCIKNKSGNIERVSDRAAQERVSTGQWVYVPKHEYKEYKDYQEREMKLAELIKE